MIHKRYSYKIFIPLFHFFKNRRIILQGREKFSEFQVSRFFQILIKIVNYYCIIVSQKKKRKKKKENSFEFKFLWKSQIERISKKIIIVSSSFKLKYSKIKKKKKKGRERKKISRISNSNPHQNRKNQNDS